MGGAAKRTYIVAWTVANAEAPTVEAVEMTADEAAEVERTRTASRPSSCSTPCG